MARFLLAAILNNFQSALDYKKNITLGIFAANAFPGNGHKLILQTKRLFRVIGLCSMRLQFFLFLCLVSCTQTDSFRTEFALGTVCTVLLYEHGSEVIYNDIFNRIREIENLMSVYIASSDISRINNSAGIEPVQVHKDTFDVIAAAIYFAELSGGAFDPTVGTLVSLWGIGGSNQRVPSQNEIDNVLPLINWHNIELDPLTNSVFFKNSGMALDLGAIAKGYAADEALKIVKKAGIDRALIDFGGNIIIYGEKKDKSPWRAGIQNPEDIRGNVIGYLQLTENTIRTIVTSGVYERFFVEDNIRYHHIFNPLPGLQGKQGYPVQNGLLSVTIITEISMNADALSTAVFVLGYEKGLSLVNSLAGVDAIFVFEDRSVIATPGANFILTNNSFRLMQY
jgi:thiamine biosynthesis lipoprotein